MASTVGPGPGPSRERLQHSEEGLAAAEATIKGTLGDILLQMKSRGGESSTLKEGAGKRSVVEGMRHEISGYAMALLGEPSWKNLAPEIREKLIKDRQALVKSTLLHETKARLAHQRRSSRKSPLRSNKDSQVGVLKHRMKARRQGAGRPEESVAEAGKAVVDTNLEGSDSFIQEKSENELVKRLEMMEICPEIQLYAEEDYFREAILRALIDIKEKMENKNKKKDDCTLLLILLLLRSMSTRLDQGGYDENNEIDKGKSAIETCFGTNEGTDTTMVESDMKPAAYPSATNSMTIQAETLRQMFKDSSDSINEGMDTTMVESFIKPAEDPSATNSRTIQVETLQQMVKDSSGSMRSAPAMQEHTPVLGSDKVLIKPAGPSATDSKTRLGYCPVQDDLDHDKMTKQMAREEENFAQYRRDWEAIWSKTCGSFEHLTTLSSMQFTSYAPRSSPYNVSIAETLQIFSIKLAEISGEIGWPLSVYGVVAVRDVVDHNRNFLFYCNRDNSQELRQDDPFLRLIGPSRAVVYKDTLHFEIKLRVKGTTRSEDKTLIAEGRTCRRNFGNGASSLCFENCFCKIELCGQMVRRTIQATILGVQVVNSEQWPFKYGARVACSSLPGKIHVTEDNRVTHVTYPASGELVMVDSKDGANLVGGDGYLQLSRNVVSVEDRGRLDVAIQTYSKSGHTAAHCLVHFPPRYSKITRKHCSLGGVKVVITVAWSRVAEDKCHVMSVGTLVQARGS